MEHLSALEFVRRLEAVCKRGETVERRNAKCEVCGDNIPRYIGPEEGIVCASCLKTNIHAFYCGNLTPGDWSGANDYEITGEP